MGFDKVGLLVLEFCWYLKIKKRASCSRGRTSLAYRWKYFRTGINLPRVSKACEKEIFFAEMLFFRLSPPVAGKGQAKYLFKLFITKNLVCQESKLNYEAKVFVLGI